jgi:queuine/archaeosine tRNA-ribosyltransferase
MFRKKRSNEAPPQSDAQAAPAPRMSGGYQVTELPTFHGRKRKVVVYTSDANGKIIKTIKH